jgi:TolB-like protein/Flp pilus assembly protein TadD
MNPSNFFAELKRRNVYKVAVAYAVISWLLIQAASILFPTFEAPSWVMKVFVAVIVLGFPAALIVSWAFEITPEGLKLEAEVAPSESRTRRTGRKIVGITVVLGVIATGLMLFQFLRLKNTVTPRSIEAAPASGTAAASSAIPQKSIAVLPFENLSDEKQNAYFAEGVQDEILTRLAKVADLKVISRTSTLRFKSAPADLREIAKQLGVTNILEGSVQKANDQVRVNVQLINALTDTHLWAESYDRKLIDIFAVESDVAQRIALALEAKLSGSEERAINARPTENTEAYQFYLKGRFFWNKRTGDDLKTAADLFQRAIAADPGYAGAYAALAATDLLIPVFGAGPTKEFLAKATTTARRAIELDETSAEAHSVLAMVLLFDLKFVESEAEFKRAIQLNPNYATAHQWYGNSFLTSLGRFDEAIREGERSVQLDPLSLVINTDLGSTLVLARRYDESIAQLRRTLALDPNFAYAHWNLGVPLYLKGDVTGAISEFEKAASLDDDPLVEGLLGRAYAETGRRDKAEAILQKLKERGEHQYVRTYAYVFVYIGLGDKAKAIECLERAYELSETPDMGWIKIDPLLDPLRDEPRFREIVAKMFSHHE